MVTYGLVVLATQGVLLGGQARYVHMGRRFQRGGSRLETGDLLVLLVVLVAVTAAVWLLSWYLNYREKRGHDSPRRLFHELCRAHRIGWSDRHLLRQLARWHRLPCPSLLFLDPQRFDLEQAGPAFSARSGRLVALRDRLFASE